ncbi:MAG: GNAT family N-acetyltransferase [Nocardioidaceae bacterium]
MARHGHPDVRSVLLGSGQSSLVITSAHCRARIEEHAVQAWPAPVSQHTDGWLVRHTPGMRRLRASGAALPRSSTSRVCSTLHLVEAFYADLDVRAAVQVSPAADYPELDRHLAARGYGFTAPIQVLTALKDTLTPATRRDSRWEVTFRDAPTPAWLHAFAVLDGQDDSAAVADQVVSKIAVPKGFASVSAGDDIVGVGLAVGGDDEWAGVYCMATHPDHRRRGMGAAILRAIADWAIEHGATGLYLQVEQANTAAQQMYTSVGFSHAYDYHYRVAFR